MLAKAWRTITMAPRLILTGRSKRNSSQEHHNHDDKPTHGVAHHHFESIIQTPLTPLCVPKRDLIVLASFLNYLFNVINNENDINDEVIYRIKKNQGV